VKKKGSEAHLKHGDELRGNGRVQKEKKREKGPGSRKNHNTNHTTKRLDPRKVRKTSKFQGNVPSSAVEREHTMRGVQTSSGSEEDRIDPGAGTREKMLLRLSRSRRRPDLFRGRIWRPRAKGQECLYGRLEVKVIRWSN